MARIRNIKPEMRKSLTVSSWSYEVRWTFVGLLTYVDDAGRGIDELRLLKAELYPLDDDMTPALLDRQLGEMGATGTVCRYEVDGRRYLHFVNWAEHQKVYHARPSRVPPCPKHEDPHFSDAEPSSSDTRPKSSDGDPRADLSKPAVISPRVRADQGSGIRDQGTDNDDPRTARGSARPSTSDRFDEFWAVYPKKVAKAAAQARWNTRIKAGVDPDAIIAGAKAYARQVRDTEPRFIKQPDGWLLAGRWADETATAEARPAGWEFGMDPR